MPDLHSKIILCKGINVDRDYVNVLSYSENQMVTLCQSKAIASASDYQFIREHNSIYTNFTYAQCVQANYIAFQNPDYSNKWFFAFIDEIIYQGEENTEIKFTIDSWSTWFSYWTKKPCYVIRHHVNDDTVGANTVEENLDTGKYIIDELTEFSDLKNMAYIIQVTEWISGTNPPLATNYGGIFYTGGAYICPDISTAITILTAYGRRIKDVVYGFYMCPSAIINLPNDWGESRR